MADVVRHVERRRIAVTELVLQRVDLDRHLLVAWFGLRQRRHVDRGAVLVHAVDRAQDRAARRVDIDDAPQYSAGVTQEVAPNTAKLVRSSPAWPDDEELARRIRRRHAGQRGPCDSQPLRVGDADSPGDRKVPRDAAGDLQHAPRGRISLHRVAAPLDRNAVHALFVERDLRARRVTARLDVPANGKGVDARPQSEIDQALPEELVSTPRNGVFDLEARDDALARVAAHAPRLEIERAAVRTGQTQKLESDGFAETAPGAVERLEIEAQLVVAAGQEGVVFVADANGSALSVRGRDVEGDFVHAARRPNRVRTCDGADVHGVPHAVERNRAVESEDEVLVRLHPLARSDALLAGPERARR